MERRRRERGLRLFWNVLSPSSDGEQQKNSLSLLALIKPTDSKRMTGRGSSSSSIQQDPKVGPQRMTRRRASRSSKNDEPAETPDGVLPARRSQRQQSAMVRKEIGPAASNSNTSDDSGAAAVASSTSNSTTAKRKRTRSASAETNTQQLPKEPSARKRRATRTPTLQPLQIVNCGICFEENYQFAGILDCCSHWYCFDCIFRWMENSNTCPQCKRRVKTIAKTEVATGKKVETKRVKKKDLNSAPAGQPILAFGPNFALTTPEQVHMLLNSQLTPDVMPFVFNLLFNQQYDDDDDDDEEWYEDDNDDESFSGSLDFECRCCGYYGYSSVQGVCPNCLCDGWHEDETEDSDDEDGPGTRDNPIEID